jgi:ubiquinone/menaquinone biosynthesis C-methylase UbiE
MQHETAHAPKTAGSVIHWARWYDRFDRAIPFVRRVRNELVDLAAPVQGDQVLDVGCGTGTLALALKVRMGAGKVYGIDPSPEMIAVAKEKAAKAGADIDFRLATIEALPFADSSLDIVTSTLMLHHLPRDVKAQGLAQVRRVLEPGGRFLTADFAAQSHSALGHLISVFGGHARGESTAAELVPMLKEAGFGDVDVITTRHKKFAFLRAR